jgi:hypothetical protein
MDADGIEVLERAHDSLQLEALQTPEIIAAIVTGAFDSGGQNMKSERRREIRFATIRTGHPPKPPPRARVHRCQWEGKKAKPVT